MELNDRDIKRLSVLLLIIALGILVIFLIRPVIISILWGLVLAYVFLPIYNFIYRYVRNRTLSASFSLVILLALILIPAWFVIPIAVDNVFELFKLSQSLDVQSFLRAIFPSASEGFISQIAVAISGGISKVSSYILNFLVNFLVSSPSILLNLFIAAFVFFFTLRDKDKLKDFAAGLSPLGKNHEKVLVKQFKDITQSIVYGQIIVGIVQGLVAGLGFLIFGVENAFVLTVLAIVFSTIPIVGPGIVWLPVTILLFVNSNPVIATGYLVYNLVITSTIDNFLRIYIISRRTEMSQAFILIGIIGGIFFLGPLGLILGPLIMAYFVTFLKIYKEKAIASLFED